MIEYFSFAFSHTSNLSVLPILWIVISILLFGIGIFFLTYIVILPWIVRIFRHWTSWSLISILPNTIDTLTGKSLVVLFIEYGQRFSNISSYSSVRDIFEHFWYSREDIEHMYEVLYGNAVLFDRLIHRLREHLLFMLAHPLS